MSDATFTPAQASAIVDLPLRTVHKLIDSRLIRPKRTRVGRAVLRLLSRQQLVYLRLEAEGVRLLPLAARREVARALEASPEADVVLLSQGPALTIQVQAVRQEVNRQLARLKEAQQMVVSDAEIMQGTPVYRGTRIPVELVAEMLAQGAKVDEILAGYPALDRENVELAPLYVRAFPRRGRPAQRPWAGQGPARGMRLAAVATR